MIRVYGYSDDNLEVEGAPYPNDEISCFERIVRIGFTDGTIIDAWYGKKGQAIWTIEVIEKGTARQTLTICEDEDADIYSDVFEIEADFQGYQLLK